MSQQQELVAEPDAVNADEFRLELSDVTGTHSGSFSGEASLPADTVASVVAARMKLPENVPWSLHDDHGTFLEGDRPIGDQVRNGSKLWVSPKTHLG